MNSHTFVMGFEITTIAGSVLKPTQFSVWDQNSRFSEFLPQAPLNYFNDVLVGLQFHKMFNYVYLNENDRPQVDQLIKEICPYYSLFLNSSKKLSRIQNMQFTQPKEVSSSNAKKFETEWWKAWSHLNPQNNKWDLSKLNQCIQLINNFESDMKSTLIYNFQIGFSDQLNQQLLSLYSFLFHLRSLIALQHNTHVDDSSFESVKCDSISDYLPRADFTTNDALIYWQFKKLSTPFIGHKDKDIRIEKLFVEPMDRAFLQFNHNACALIDQLPPEYINSLPQSDLEIHLHQIQMDWLLGSSTGLLFRIREELFGLIQGYDRLFWSETNQDKVHKSTPIRFCFELDRKWRKDDQVA